LISTDGSGNVRSSYEFNPRLARAGSNNTRKYQKITDPKTRDVFITDYMEDPNGSSPPGIPFDPVHWPHWPYQGLVVGYTDGSVNPAYSAAGFMLATKSLITDESALSAQLYDILWSYYRDAQ